MQKYNSKITIDGSKLISSLFFVLQMGCIICCRAKFFELEGWAIYKSKPRPNKERGFVF